MRTDHPTSASPVFRVALGLALWVWVFSGGVVRAQAFRTTGEGLTVGHFVLYPSVNFELTDNDNIFYASRDLPGDQIIKSGVMVVMPRLLVDLPIGENRIRWVYSPLYRDYTSKSFVQSRRTSHYFDFEATHRGSVLTVDGSYHLVLGTQELADIQRITVNLQGRDPDLNNPRYPRILADMTAEDFLNELPPPAWREDEVSVECDAARVRVDRRDLNLFVVRDTKGQPDIERELPRRTHVEHVEKDAQSEGSKDEMIARAHWARGAFDQLEPGPLRQFARVRKQEPNALGGGEEDLGRTDFHRSVSLTPYYTVRMEWVNGNVPDSQPCGSPRRIFRRR